MVLEDIGKLDCYDAVLMDIFPTQEMKVSSCRVLAHLANQIDPEVNLNSPQ